MSTVTVENLKLMFPKLNNAEEILEIFKKYFAQYMINTTNRRAGFLAQCAHESGNFTIFKENLNYSREGLLKVFPKYFNESNVGKYAKHPEMIANRVYANRMGNGLEESGEGWEFKGRGAIQLTGKSMYLDFATYKGMKLDEVISYLETLEGSIESALWFWKIRNLNKYCDTNDIVGMTRVINGGTNGLDDRKAKYEKFKAILG